MAEPVSDFENADGEQHALALEISSRTRDPEWRMAPLVDALGESLAHQFFWKAETDSIQTYEHRLSYRYVHLDKESSQFYNQRREPITADAALMHALAYAMLPLPEMSLAPVVLEPNLLPFMRPFARAETSQPSFDSGRALPEPVRTKVFFSSVSSQLRSKCRALVSYATTAADPLQSKTDRMVLGNFEQRELKLSAFTRRTV